MKHYLALKDEINGVKPAPPAVHHVESEQDFDEHLKNAGDKLVLIDFFATWCGPCKQIAPLLDTLADTHKQRMKTLKIDVDENSGLAMGRFKVKSMPTFVFLKNGETVHIISGADPDALKKAVEELIH